MKFKLNCTGNAQLRKGHEDILLNIRQELLLVKTAKQKSNQVSQTCCNHVRKQYVEVSQQFKLKFIHLRYHWRCCCLELTWRDTSPIAITLEIKITFQLLLTDVILRLACITVSFSFNNHAFYMFNHLQFRKYFCNYYLLPGEVGVFILFL